MMALFKKGEASPNPSGRPQGARNKLCTTFLRDMLEDWEQHGKAAIEIMRMERPGDYVRVVAGILPRALNVTAGKAIEDYTDEKLATALVEWRAKAAEQSVN
jgi:hypothetical protein